jgi:ribosomal protein S18 acetylase RimI-like enzyme
MRLVELRDRVRIEQFLRRDTPLQDVDTLGLNVHCENRAAVACYASLGFETVAPYVEAWFARF